MTVPEPLTGDLFERCRIALTHTLDGLAELDRQKEREEQEEIRLRKKRVSVTCGAIMQLKNGESRNLWLCILVS